MKTNRIKRMTISCAQCDTTVSFDLPDRPLMEFVCPVCGESLHDSVTRALKTALGYNRAAAEVMQCQQECDVTFLTE